MKFISNRLHLHPGCIVVGTLIFLGGLASVPGLRAQDKEKTPIPPAKKTEGDDKEESVKPGINERFLDPNIDIKEWMGRFEVESREVAHSRDEIVKALEVEPGMAVADIGAGTGLFLEPLAKAVSAEGKVYAVDISLGFVKNLSKRAKELKLSQVKAKLCRENSVDLDENSVDLAFVCDTYHHFEYPKSTLASIYRALKPGGRLVVIDFERIPGTSSEWILGHVRAGKEVFSSEIVSARFEQVKEVEIKGFKDNYFLVFRKPAES